MFSPRLLLFMALFAVALAHRHDWFSTRASYTPCPPLTRVAKNLSYLCSCRKFPTMVNGRGLMLLLLLGGDVSLNPGPFTLGVLNARSVRNKGPLLADMVASYDLDLLCLTETHIHPFDSDSFLRSITPPDFNFPHKPCPSGIGGGVGFFIRSSYRPHIIETPCYQSFENIVVSIGLHGHSVLLACIYRPPGSCTCNFLEEFMSFVGYLSSINYIPRRKSGIYWIQVRRAAAAAGVEISLWTR